MVRKQRRLSAILSTLGFLSVIAFLVTVSTAAPATRQVLIFGVDTSDIGGGDPHFATSSSDRPLADMLFNGLVRFKPGDSTVFEPDLAERIPEPRILNGKQTWTFSLRKGVMCHPGPKTKAYELTADDVVYSFRKSADPKRSAWSAIYKPLTVDKIDAYTVRITSDPPVSRLLFLPKVANYQAGYIVCSRAIAAMGDDAFKANPVGTGPFIYKSYRSKSSLDLVANDRYFRGRPRLSGVRMVFMPNAASREAALRTGEIHAAHGLQEGQWVARINASGNLRAEIYGPAEVYFINFNMTMPPLDDLRVRQAIAYAINRDAHVALHGAAVAEKVYSVVNPRYLPGGLTREEAERRGLTYDFNVAKARELLTAAGYPNGFSVVSLSAEETSMRKNHEVLHAELRAVGIDLKYKVVDVATYHAQIRQGASPVTLYPAWRPNADLYLSQFFHSDATVVTGKSPISNFSHYRNADQLIVRARNETDPAKQASLWKEANAKILADVAAFPYMAVKRVDAVSKKVVLGHELKSVLALYPQFTEQTWISP